MGRAPIEDRAPIEEFLKIELKTSEEMTTGTPVQKLDGCPAEVQESAKAPEPTALSSSADELAELQELGASSCPAIKRFAARRLQALAPAVEPPPPPEPPAAPLEPLPAAPVVAAADLPPTIAAAVDGAWARLLAARSGPTPAPSPSPSRVPTAAALAPVPALPRRREVGAAVGELARAAADGDVSAVDVLAAGLADRWKDGKPATRSFFASGLAELVTGLITPDLLVGLVADADRSTVGLKSRQFSRALGRELAAARRAKKNRSPVRTRTIPATGEQKQTPSTTRL